MEDITTTSGEVAIDGQLVDLGYDEQSGNIAEATTRASSHASGERYLWHQNQPPTHHPCRLSPL